jgi:hypothetical protein
LRLFSGVVLAGTNSDSPLEELKASHTKAQRGHPLSADSERHLALAWCLIVTLFVEIFVVEITDWQKLHKDGLASIVEVETASSDDVVWWRG